MTVIVGADIVGSVVIAELVFEKSATSKITGTPAGIVFVLSDSSVVESTDKPASCNDLLDF